MRVWYNLLPLESDPDFDTIRVLTPISLGDVSLCSAALDRAFLMTSDDSSLLQLVGQVRNTAHELAVILCTVRALHNQVGDSAASRE